MFELRSSGKYCIPRIEMTRLYRPQALTDRHGVLYVVAVYKDVRVWFFSIHSVTKDAGIFIFYNCCLQLFNIVATTEAKNGCSNTNLPFFRRQYMKFPAPLRFDVGATNDKL